MLLADIAKKRVLILGFAREGKDTLKFLRTYFPNKVFGIADQKESLLNLPKKKVKLYLGKDYLKAIKQYDVIIRSPGIPLRKVQPLLKVFQLPTGKLKNKDIFWSLARKKLKGRFANVPYQFYFFTSLLEYGINKGSGSAFSLCSRNSYDSSLAYRKEDVCF